MPKGWRPRGVPHVRGVQGSGRGVPGCGAQDNREELPQSEVRGGSQEGAPPHPRSGRRREELHRVRGQGAAAREAAPRPRLRAAAERTTPHPRPGWRGGVPAPEEARAAAGRLHVRGQGGSREATRVREQGGWRGSYPRPGAAAEELPPSPRPGAPRRAASRPGAVAARARGPKRLLYFQGQEGGRW